MSTVNLLDVCKIQGSQTILSHLNLKIDKGEFIVVVGPSGCGKSTLLRLISGLDSLSSGKILINNQCVNTIPPAERDIAMVFQHFALYPHMTVYENMAYGLKMRGMKKPFIQERVHAVAQVLELQEYLLRKPAALSGGQKQRVAMGRAMVRSPSLFLFDEPLSSLDAKLRTSMRYEIKKLHQELNSTCLYVTHDQIEAMTLATRVVVLKGGVIEQVGTPKMLYQEPDSLFVASFLGHYPVNLLAAKIDLSQSKILTELGLEFPLPNLKTQINSEQEVTIAIRPEHLNICPNITTSEIVLRVRFIDDLGADKLVYLSSECERLRFTVRTVELNVDIGHSVGLEWISKKGSIFDKTTGLRLGGWNG
jgi:sn-glycerol 3-phosphate transport system ATP-binding protein